MQRLFLASVALLVAASLVAGCESEDCGDHKDGTTWCDGSNIVHCIQGSATVLRSCAPARCAYDPMVTTSCVLEGAVCPTSSLGYQCLGERRVICLANGLVTNEGACSPQTQAQRESWAGPYCVENPGGSVLPCGWKKEKCSTPGQMTCFDDGSAVCVSGVYQYFLPNNKGKEATCGATPMPDCWAGKTWCEGDVLKRCDNCLNSETCGSITVEAVCGPGACVPSPPPSWMSIRDKVIYGCASDSTACVGRQGMACVNGSMAVCVDGRAIVGLTCPELQLLWGFDLGTGPKQFGPYCVERPATNDATCALDPSPCTVEKATRCAPDDPTGTLMDTCKGGVWMKRESCVDSSHATTVCGPAVIGAICK